MAAAERIAVVTGASSGIGEATARGLAGAGYRMVLGARREDRLMAVARELGGRGLALDVRDLTSIQGFARAIESEYGQVEVLVNNAGLAAGLQPLAEGSDDDWVQMMEASVIGLLRVTKALLPLLRRVPDHGPATASGWACGRSARQRRVTSPASSNPGRGTYAHPFPHVHIGYFSRGHAGSHLLRAVVFRGGPAAVSPEMTARQCA